MFICLWGDEKKLYDSCKDDDIDKFLGKRFTLDELDLNSDGEPSEPLKNLFNSYFKLVDYIDELKANSKDNSMNLDNEKENFSGKNIIFYGVPGSGKSFYIDEYIIKGKEPDSYERVVFHPDYTYSDFVGQIKPYLDESNSSVKYKFVPGPFTKILKKAIDNRQKNYYLIIEEINRGNAASIFGDLFQLLDRNENGDSKYEITNEDIAKVVYGALYEDKKISIPENLSILCTMNTSDQNVFTLDTAFQRRWEMKLRPNTLVEGDPLKDKEICDTKITWENFYTVINNEIRKSRNFASTEDKSLGAHFVSKKELEDPTLFAEKVLKYLWDDAFKFNRDKVFEHNFGSLEDIIENFKNKNGREKFKFLKGDILEKLGINDLNIEQSEN